MYKKAGFTLAEVLITLGIIGVVAALTMPVLITSYKKQVAAARLKKTVSVLEQAINASRIDSALSSSASEEEFADFFTKQLKITTTCENEESACGLTTFKCLHGNDSGLALSKRDYRYVLADGTFIGFKNPYIYVDINGNKGPDKLGYDVFMIQINMKDAFVPKIKKRTSDTGNDKNFFENDGQGCNKANTFSGKYCFERVMYNHYDFDYWK